MRLYLLRHGETDWNRSHRFQGRIDIPLNQAGRDLAIETRRNMPVIQFDKVYCSPLIRAVETSHILLEGRFPIDDIIIDERISEVCFGEWEGCDIDAVSEDPSHPLYECLWHPDLYYPEKFNSDTKAESLHRLAERAGAFLRDEIMPLEGKCDNVLIVAHGALNRAIVVAAGYKTVADFWAIKYPNCCLTTLDITEGKATLVRESEIFYQPDGSFTGWKNEK
ncbi:MAG: histidine phosphatase family protein [Bacteroidales bacterium]|nr:histidine phosphatase family protein [Candidatus Liminaster caballi]